MYVFIYFFIHLLQDHRAGKCVLHHLEHWKGWARAAINHEAPVESQKTGLALQTSYIRQTEDIYYKAARMK